MKKSAILEAVHETAQGLHQAGVMDLVTLREFDRLCLPPVEPLEPEQILSNHLLALSVEDLAMAQRNDELIEVLCDEKISNS